MRIGALNGFKIKGGVFMAVFCSDDCKDMGSICDFCKHYRDEYRDILKLNEFAGNGVCAFDNSEVDACDGYNCDNFMCFRIENNT